MKFAAISDRFSMKFAAIVRFSMTDPVTGELDIGELDTGELDTISNEFR